MNKQQTIWKSFFLSCSLSSLNEITSPLIFSSFCRLFVHFAAPFLARKNSIQSDLLQKHRAFSSGLSCAVMQRAGCVRPALYHRPCIDLPLSFRTIRNRSVSSALFSVSSFVEFPLFQLRCRGTFRRTKVAPTTTNRYELCKLQAATNNISKWRRAYRRCHGAVGVCHFFHRTNRTFCCATKNVIQAVALVSSHGSCLLVLENRMSIKRCPSHRIRLHNRA